MNILIDSGHGGINKSGEYVTAPSKMFEFNNGEVAYEGHINRQLELMVKFFLLRMVPEATIVSVADSYIDTPLWKRVKLANQYDPKDTVYVSLHSNASRKHNASGFSIYTTVGETQADVLARSIFRAVAKSSKSLGITMRRTRSDVDIEKNFYVLKHTKCPAVLVESLFFDHRRDFKKLKQPLFLMRLAEGIAEGIVNYIK